MIDHMGREVISSNRVEINQGLTRSISFQVMAPTLPLGWLAGPNPMKSIEAMNGILQTVLMASLFSLSHWEKDQ